MDASPDTLTVIVPLYNEERRVEASARAILEALSPHGLVELILVDDGSTDGTGRRLSELARAHAYITPLAHARNRGKGYAVRRALACSRTELVCYTDADLSAALGDYGRLRAAIAAGADIAIGSRVAPGAVIGVAPPRYREALGRAGNLLLRLTDPPLRPFGDTQCGFKLLRGAAARAIAPSLTVDRWGFDFELLHVAIRQGYRIAEIPIHWSDSEVSRVGRWDHARTLVDLARVLWNDARGAYGRAAAPPADAGAARHGRRR